MTATSSSGDDPKGSKKPVKKAAKTALKPKGKMEKLSGSDTGTEAKTGTVGIDKISKAVFNQINKDPVVADNEAKQRGGRRDAVTDQHENMMHCKMVADKWEQEIKRIEDKIQETTDKGEKSVLETQLKGAQRSLKDALVNISLVQKTSQFSIRDDGKMQIDLEAGMEEYNDAARKVEQEDEMSVDGASQVAETDMENQDEPEFFTDNKEDTSDTDEDTHQAVNDGKANKKLKSTNENKKSAKADRWRQIHKRKLYPGNRVGRHDR